MKTRQRGGFLNTIKESMSNMYAKAKETVTKKTMPPPSLSGQPQLPQQPSVIGGSKKKSKKTKKVRFSKKKRVYRFSTKCKRKNKRKSSSRH